jgi:hypothetical protein
MIQMSELESMGSELNVNNYEADDMSSISFQSEIDPGLYVPFSLEEMIQCAWKFADSVDEDGNPIDQIHASQQAFQWWRDAAELAGAPYEEILFAQDQTARAIELFASGQLGNVYDRTPIFWATYFKVWDAVDVLEDEVEIVN